MALLLRGGDGGPATARNRCTSDRLLVEIFFRPPRRDMISQGFARPYGQDAYAARRVSGEQSLTPASSCADRATALLSTPLRCREAQPAGPAPALVARRTSHRRECPPSVRRGPSSSSRSSKSGRERLGRGSRR